MTLPERILVGVTAISRVSGSSERLDFPRPSTKGKRVANLPTASSLTRKLATFMDLSPDEIAVLEELQSSTSVVQHNREIIVQGRSYDSLLVLVDGIAIRYRVLRDSRRQILNVVLPGDFIGFPAAFFDTALFSIGALTDTVLATIPFVTLAGLFSRQPRLAIGIFWSFASETALYAEHLVGIGRRSALERIAHFLLELLARFRAIGLADERSFSMPLTQEVIGDALGLSVPYVNLILRQLRRDNLVRIEEHRVIIRDVEALSVLADFDRAFLSRYRMPEPFAEIGSSKTAPS